VGRGDVTYDGWRKRVRVQVPVTSSSASRRPRHRFNLSSQLNTRLVAGTLYSPYFACHRSSGGIASDSQRRLPSARTRVRRSRVRSEKRAPSRAWPSIGSAQHQGCRRRDRFDTPEASSTSSALLRLGWPGQTVKASNHRQLAAMRGQLARIRYSGSCP
jgi:hypothetical protein